MGKYRDSRRKGNSKLSRSETNEFFSAQPISEQMDSHAAVESELRCIFNSTLSVLQSICKQQMFSPESLKTIRILRNTYFKFYDQVSKNGVVPFFPLVTRTDLARVIECASTHTSVDAFLADYADNMPCKAQLSDEKAGQLAELFNQMEVIDSVSKRFEEVFSNRGEGLVLPDDMEYKKVLLWVEWIIEIYPFSGRKLLLRLQPRAQVECALMVLAKAENSMIPVESKTHKEYSDPLKENLEKALDSLFMVRNKVELFQFVEAESNEFNKTMVSLLCFLSHTKKHGLAVKSLWTFHRIVQDDIVNYMRTGDSEQLNGSIEDLRNELFELWPSEGE